MPKQTKINDYYRFERRLQNHPSINTGFGIDYFVRMNKLFGRIVFAVLISGGLFGGAVAQTTNSSIIPKDNSPMSRIGLGDFTRSNFAGQMGMGSVGVALVEGFQVNPINPASLAFLKNTSFEAAFDVRNNNRMDQTGASNDSWTGNLQYLSLGFPLQNPINQALENRDPNFSWGMNLSLQPYTNVGYNIEVQEDAGEFGTYTNRLKGTGGTYQLTWGNGWRYKNFAVGVNASYIFGKITNSRRVSLDDLALFAYSTEFLDEFSVSGLQFKGGVQYVINLDPEVERDAPRLGDRRRIIFGATATNEASFNTDVSRFYNRDNLAIRLNTIDTILEVNDLEMSGTLPSEFGFGVTYENIDKIRLSAEYTMGNWSNFRNEVQPDVLSDNYRAALGLEWIPDIVSFNRYYERLRYRFGAFYGTDPRSFNGTQLEHYGLSLGVGLPIVMPRQALSFLHISLEAGQINAGDQFRENYIQTTLGFTLNDNTWFFKRKFN